MADAELADARRKAELADLHGRINGAGQAAVDASPAPTTESAGVPGPTDGNNDARGVSSNVRRDYIDSPEARAARSTAMLRRSCSLTNTSSQLFGYGIARSR